MLMTLLILSLWIVAAILAFTILRAVLQGFERRRFLREELRKLQVRHKARQETLLTHCQDCLSSESVVEVACPCIPSQEQTWPRKR